MFKPSITWYSVDGLIGSGKTSALAQLRKRLQGDDNFFLIDEPLNLFLKFEMYDFKNEETRHYNPLQLAYEDPKENALVTQFHILDRLVEFYRKQFDTVESLVASGNKKVIIISERSFESTTIFIENYFKQGIFSQFARDFLIDKWARICPVDCIPTAVIYLDVNDRVAFERIRSRGRVGERNISSSYMNSLRSCYESYLTYVNRDRKVVSLSVNNISVDVVADRILERVKEINAVYNAPPLYSPKMILTEQ
jgi:thymidylate kinase